MCSIVCRVQDQTLSLDDSQHDGGELSMRGKVSIGLLKRSEVKSMANQLQAYKISISIMITTASLRVGRHK
jgi:hypothetical protein